MTLTVILYVALFTVLTAAAAAAVEWGVQGRVPARHFWSIAIVLALAVPPATLAWVSLATYGASANGESSHLLLPIIVRSDAVNAQSISRTIVHTSMLSAWLPSEFALPEILSISGDTVAYRALLAWMLASASLAGWITVGLWRWRRAQRTWHRTVLDGVTVDVSQATGPAVLGIIAPSIVLPSWATELPTIRRQLMLAHECEHMHARDPQRLAIAALALVLMPWNAALWWSVARLRRAIELDCDARVLRRFPKPKEYGYLLLEVAEHGRNTGALAMPLVGLLRVPSELEFRLRAITRPHSAARRVLIGGAAAALVLLAAAFTTPVPQVVHGDAAPQQAAVQSVTAVRDTVPAKHGDSVTMLQHRVDSLALAARRLDARRRALALERARVDSAQAKLQIEQRKLRALRTEPSNRTMTYFDFQVDTPVTQKSTSSAPRYPAAERAAKQSGEVDVKFVVDTTGKVDMRTVSVVHATAPAFEQAVLTALPTMTFTPARIGNVPVRQLVQQPFMFSISH